MLGNLAVYPGFPSQLGEFNSRSPLQQNLLAEVDRLRGLLDTAREALADIATLNPSEAKVAAWKAQRIYDATAD